MGSGCAHMLLHEEHCAGLFLLEQETESEGLWFSMMIRDSLKT